MGLYERIKEIANANGYSINRLEKELGFARSSISKFNKNVPSMEKIRKIANLLNVSTDSILEEKMITEDCITCPDCGLLYDSSYGPDVEDHIEEHRAWERASEVFGKLYCNREENEKIKAENRNIRNNTDLSIFDRYNAELKVLRCLFSRSVQANQYDLNHVDFDKYVSMMLGNKKYVKNLDNELLEKLIEKYGTSSGIEHGSIYKIPSKKPATIAAHLDTDDLTDEERLDVENYIAFLKSKRK